MKLSKNKYYEITKKLNIFLNNIIKRKVFWDFINDKIGYISLKLFSLILIILLSRILTPSELGKYYVFLSLTFLISGLLDFGIPIAIVRYLPNLKDKELINSYIALFFRVLILISIISFPFLLIFSKKISLIFFKSINFLNVVVAYLTALIFIFNNSLKSVFLSFKKFEILRNISFLEGLFKLTFITLLAFFFRYKGSILGFLLTYSFLLFLYLYFLKKYLGINLIKVILFEKIESIKENFIDLVKYLFLLNLNTLSRSLYGWLDTLIISALLNLKEVGYYRVALAFIFALLPLSNLNSILLPRFSQWDLEKIRKNLKKIVLVNLLISIPTFVFFYFVSPILVPLIFGEKYINAIPLVKVGLIIIILNSFAVFIPIFNLKGIPQYSSLIIFISAIFNAIGDFIFIKQFGLIGSIYATILAWIVSLILSFIVYLKFIKYS